MKLLKSAAIRATALLLFFALIAAVVLYQAGVYDIVFIQRPPALLPEGSDTTSDTESFDSTTLPPETDPADTTDVETDPPEPPVDLNAILSLSQATELGYSLSSQRFGKGSMLARLDYDFGEGSSIFSLRTEKITSTVFYQKESGLFATKKVTTEVDKPRVSLYFGLIVIDNGKTVDIYNAKGKNLIKNFSGEWTGALSEKGYPVVKIKKKYYEIHPEKGLSSAISSKKIQFRALAFDHPLDYGAFAFDLYPYSANVDIYTEVKLEEETEEPPADTNVSTQDTEGIDSQTEGATSDTVADTITESATPTETEATEVGETESLQLLRQAKSEATSSDTETSARDDTDVAPSADTTVDTDTTADTDTTTDTDADTDVTTDNDTTADTDAGADTDDTSSEDDKPEPKPLPEGVVEIDGKYYTVSQKLMWGYRDAEGNTVIEPQFASAYAFSEDGLAAVTDFNDNVFYINTEGKEVVSIRKKVYINPPEMSNIRIRQFYFEPITNGIENLGTYYFDEGYTMIRYCWVSNFNTKQIYLNAFRLVDTKGNVFEIPGGYILKNYSDGILLLEKDGLYGYMDTTGAWISPAVYREAHPFLQGLAVAVNEEGKYGLLDREGHEVLPFVFDHLSNVSDGKIAAYSAERGWEIYCVTAKPAS